MRGPATLALVATLCAPAVASAQSLSARTGIYLRAGASLSVLDASSLRFTADSESTAARMAMPLEFSGKQLGWRRGALMGGTLGAALDARWFYVRIGVDLYGAPPIDVQPERYRADVLTLAWAALGPRYAWSHFAVHLGARLGAAVMALRSSNGALEYTAITGTYYAEAGFQWRPLSWLELDATVSQDFASLTATTLHVALNVGWSRPR